MKKFSFSLQGILNYWLHAEEREKTELTRLLAEHQHLGSQLSKVQSGIDQSETGLRKAKEIKVPEIKLYRQHISALKTIADDLVRKQKELEETIHSQRASLARAVVKRKALDRLKSKKEQHYWYQLDREEQKNIDELYAQRRPDR